MKRERAGNLESRATKNTNTLVLPSLHRYSQLPFRYGDYPGEAVDDVAFQPEISLTDITGYRTIPER